MTPSRIEVVISAFLTVGQNVLAGHEGSGWRWPKPAEAHDDLFAELGIDRVLRDTPLGELGIAIQQRTEIVRALVRDARRSSA